VFPDKSPALVDELVRMNGDEWEPCAFSLDGHQVGVLRGDESIPRWIALSGISEVLVHHDARGAITEIELCSKDDQRIAARLRPTLIETMISRAWEAGATITASDEVDQRVFAGSRHHQNF
jgi:hypothetical protein